MTYTPADFKYAIINIMNSKKRHLAKTVTWRITATTTTILITWMVTGDIAAGLTVGGFEATAKMFLYYGHERLWHKTDFGRS